MAASPFRPDRKGIGEILKTEFVTEVNRLAQEVGDQCGDDVEVRFYTTDRGAASVTVPAEVQAKEGALTRAATAVGLEVKAK
ncbi:hypothetical protein A5788_22350 [Gordonia sp. 852002-50816_SCH5313054-c]|uniref:hypothetical protein n=1 Tax=unclassified Gordonia (in: high G+C Gram-positive bacteria) TaxID=2657482 RepID=UPI0007E97AEF|nr:MULTISPECIES: hypothetical protein [unclassified Gordonia (in: high G+C Gram-positive bacteria)]OBC12181.1 hypothetical protein A5788_22350 [Gordonia sp. 852002-50816_SCH5313054-c]OBC17606.1 hypothetical protein A5786_18970 [Gordonia sp. 852002-50816_SCH5313054-a]